MATVLELKQAGYSDEEINLWVEDKRKVFNDAGYTLAEQSDHLGIPIKSTNPYLNNSLLGSNSPLHFEAIDDDPNLTEKQKIDRDILKNTETDDTTKTKEDSELIKMQTRMKEMMNLADINKSWMPYKFQDQLEHEAFANKNKLITNLIDKDLKGKELVEAKEDEANYYENFTLNNDLIDPQGSTFNTINVLDNIYRGLELKPNEIPYANHLLNEFMKHSMKVLSGNANYGARSYSWGDGTFGPFRMTATQVQEAVNSYVDILTQLKQPLPYWIDELQNDKDVSGLPEDAKTALFLAYISKRPNFAKHFKSLITSDKEVQKEGLRNLLNDTFLIPRNTEKNKFKRNEIILDPDKVKKRSMTSYTDELIKWEGHISKAKIATKGEEFFTVGFGDYGEHVLEGTKETVEVSKKNLIKNIEKRLPKIIEAIPNFNSLPIEVRTAIIVGWFRGDIAKGHDTVKLINQGKFKEAAAEYLKHEGYETAVEKGRSGIRPRMEYVRDALLAYAKALEEGTAFEQYDEFKGIHAEEFSKITDRFIENLNQKWGADSETTTTQLPSFGKWMPDALSMSGDHLMGEGRKSVIERGAKQSVMFMMHRLYKDLKELNDTGANPMDARKLIDEFMTGGQRWDKRALGGLVSVVSDLGVYGAGSAPFLLTKNPYLIMGGAFGLHEALRWALIESYISNETNTFEGFWDLVLSKTFAKHYGKGFATGVAVAVGGKVGGKVMNKMLTKTPLANSVVGNKIINTGTKWGALGGEISMLATVPALMEGHLPVKEDFIDAAVIIIALKTGIRGVKASTKRLNDMTRKLYYIYAKTGKPPRMVMEDAKKDPDILDDMMNKDKEVPEAYEQEVIAIKDKLNESVGRTDETSQQSFKPPKFIVGSRVNADNTGIFKAEIIDVSFKDGQHIYKIRKGDGEIVNVPENILTKSTPSKEVVVWKDTTEFKKKQESGEYDSKIEVLERDNQIFETTKHRTSQAISPNNRNVGGSNDGLAQTNGVMLWLKSFYPKLVKATDKYVTKGFYNMSLPEMLKKAFLNKKVNESPIRLLFKVEKGNNLGVERPILVGDVNGKIFSFDLHAYMALKKLMDGSDAVVTAHTHVKESGASMHGVLIFRNKDGLITGVLASRGTNEKVTNEATKFKNEFGMDEKPFANMRIDEPSPKSRKEGGFPDWSDLDPHKDTNVFRGLELRDLIKIFRELSTGNVIADKIRGRKFETILGQFYPIQALTGTAKKKGEKIVLNEELFSKDQPNYKKKLEDILMVMAHELGHALDYLPQKDLARGNILNRLATLKQELTKWISGKADSKFSPMTKEEIANMRKEAERRAKTEVNQIDKDLKDLGYDPKDILKVFTDKDARSILPPAVYEAYAKASSTLKKAIIRDALKGITNTVIRDALLPKNKRDTSRLIKAKAKQIYEKMLENEVIKRGLVGLDEIMIEMKAVTQRYGPFNERFAPEGIGDLQWKKFVAYRYSASELMAEFMMSFLLHPKELQKIAPISVRTWLSYMDRKPEFLKIWNEIQTELNLPRDKRIANFIREDIATSIDNSQKMIVKAEADATANERYDKFRRTMDFQNFTIINYFKKVYGDIHWWSAPESKKRFEIEAKNNLEAINERYIYGNTLIEHVQNRLYKLFWQPLLDSGINRHTMGVYLQNRLIMNPEGTRANVLNPKGTERNLAFEIVTHLEKDYPELRALAEKFYEFRQNEIIPLFEELGMPKEHLEIVKNNKDYMNFSVEEYANWRGDKWAANFVTAIKYGTSKDIINVLDATIVKDWALLTMLQRHQMIRFNVTFLKDAKEKIKNLNRTRVKWNKKIVGFKITQPVIERTYEPAVWDRMTKRWKPENENLDVTSTKRGWALVEYLDVDGKRQGAYIGIEIADAMNSMQGSAQMIAIHQIAYGLNTPFRKVFTELSPPFWGYNVFRDIFRTVQNLDGASLFDLIHGGKNSFLKQWVQNLPHAYRTLFDPTSDKIPAFVSEMLRNRNMISVFEGYRNQAIGLERGEANWVNHTDNFSRAFFLLSKGDKWKTMSKKEIETFVKNVHKKKVKNYTVEEKHIEYQMRDAIIQSFEKRFQEVNWLGKDKSAKKLIGLIGENSWIQPWYKTIVSAEYMARVFERTTKIAAKADMLKRRKEGLLDWTDTQIEYAVRNWAGSPNFLRKGTAAWLYNNLLLFGNVFKEENRSVLEAKRWHKQYKIPFTDSYWHGSWYGKLFMYTIAPKIMYRAAKIGMLGGAAHLYFNLIGNDILSQNTVIPLGVINDQGEFEFGIEGKGTMKAVYLQFPLDEFQKLIGTLTWHGMEETWGQVKDDAETNLYQNAIKHGIGVLDDQTPSLSPLIPLLKNAFFALGLTDQAPIDYYTGRQLYPDYVQQAEGTLGAKLRLKAFSKWAWNNTGGLMFYKFETKYKVGNYNDIISEIEEKLNIPFFGRLVGRFLKVSDQGLQEIVWDRLQDTRNKQAYYKVVMDNAINKYMTDDGKLDLSKLNAEEKHAMLADTSWVTRYSNAVQKTFGTQWLHILTGLDGQELVDAIQTMTKIQYDFNYNIDYLQEK